MKTYAIIFALLILCSSYASPPQPRLVSGTVFSSDDGAPLPGVVVKLENSRTGTVTNVDGYYSIEVPSEKSLLIFRTLGYISEEVQVGNRNKLDIRMKPEAKSLQEVVISTYPNGKTKRIKNEAELAAPMAGNYALDEVYTDYNPHHNTEEYAIIQDNNFLETTKNPLSTFSVDVDNASYSNIRRYINYGQTPPKDVVRIEEMINYFSYDYPQPKGEDPFSVNMEVSECPWKKEHKLVHIGLQGKNIPVENLPPSNLVFLIDVSGSMDTPERLPLVKSAFKMLVDQLRSQDHVSIVVYAGAAGLVLPPTSGDKKRSIAEAIDNLEAGGSTAGGHGIKLAYDIAKKHFKKGGNNRVILATDGDFNVGVSSNAEMERLIEVKRETGIFLTV